MCKIRKSEYEKISAAAKLFESDGIGAYFPVREKFGEQFASILAVAFARNLLVDKNSWPPSPESEKDVENFLVALDILEKE